MLMQAESSTETALPRAGLGTRMLHGMGWSIAGTVLARGATLAAAVIVARIVGREDFGALAMVQSSISLFAVFAGLGLSFTAMRNLAALKKTDPQRAARILHLVIFTSTVVCTLMSAVMALLAPWIAEAVLKAPHLTVLITIGALVLLFETLNTAQEGSLAGFEAFKAVALSSTAGGLLSLVLQTAGLFLGGLEGVLWGLLTARFAIWLLNRWQIDRQARLASLPRWHWDFFDEWPTLVRFGLPSFITGIVSVPFIWITGAMLVNQPGGFAEMGIFRAAYYLFVIFVTIGSTLAKPLLPISISVAGAERKRASKTTVIVTWAVALLPTLPLVLFPELAMALFGAGFAGESFRITILLVMAYTAIHLFGIGFSTIVMSNDRNWHNAFGCIVWSVGLIGSCFALLKFGSVGLAGAYLVAYSLQSFYLMVVCLRAGLLPSGTLTSPRSASVWLITASVFAVSAVTMDLFIRLLVFVASSAAIAFILWGMLKTVRRTQPDGVA